MTSEDFDLPGKACSDRTVGSAPSPRPSNAAAPVPSPSTIPTVTSVSLIATVYNEADSIEAWLGSILGQTRRPEEIVIVDAGSHDDTITILRKTSEAAGHAIRLIVAPGLNIAQGRNRAISEARGAIIAVSDAGTLLDADWLERLVSPFGDPSVDVAAGFFRPDGRNDFERVLAPVITPRLDEINPETFLPSSRSVAFRRTSWERAGGYPAWLPICEDVVFDLRLREAGARFTMAPDAIVSWFPGLTLAAFFRQYRGYGRGDGRALLFGKRHVLRYGAYITGTVCLALRRRGWPIPGLALVGGAYLRKFVWRLWSARPFDSTPRMLVATVLVPGIVATGDIAKMVGYPIGRWDRLRAIRVSRAEAIDSSSAALGDS